MATKFSRKNPNPGVWFKFDEDDPGSGEICIRAVSAGALKEFLRQTTKKREIFRAGQRYAYEESDDEKFSRLLWDYVIVDWKALEDDDGNEIPCTAETKYSLMMENVGFSRFVAQCREKVDIEIADIRDEAEKN